ncbi:MAG TPA: MmgE/PrpD family protein [Burkholderiales bacterium]|nr:MmgE/PrpD family protein [Burkholderiales bacterium]
MSTSSMTAQSADRIQSKLSGYAARLSYADLDEETIHAATTRVIDTLAALIGGFSGEPCRMTRELAAGMPQASGATVIGTSLKTSPDLAAFVNGTTARYVEMNDVYHWPGSSGGHPSDVLMPILAAAEYARANGRDFITAVVLGYEIYLRMSDAVKTPGFDCANFCCMGAALGAGKLLGLDAERLAQCLSMAVVPNNALNQARTGHLSMWKAVAAGQAGRAGVFAALLAHAGMKGPHAPFEGKAGWCDHVARRRFTLGAFGGAGTPFKIRDTSIKPRASCATTISSILAAEKAGTALATTAEIESVTVEVYERAKIGMGTGEHHWNPDSRETADHSIPYVVAAALIDKRVSPASFADERLWSPELRALLPKIEVIANEEFTAAYERVPVEHRTRVSVLLKSGERRTGYAGGEQGDLSQPKSDREIEEKFRSLTGDRLGAQRADAALAALWRLDSMSDVSEIADLVRFDR